MSAAHRLGWGLGLVQVLAWATTFYLPAVVAGPVAEDLGTSRAAVLGAFSCALILAGLLSPRAGRWIDRTGGRPVLVTGTLIQAAGLVLLALLPSLVGWYLAWIVIGVGMALGLYDAAFSTTGRHLGGAARPVIVGITLIGGFASTVGWPLGTWLLAQIGWRSTALVYAAIHVGVNLPLVLLSVPRTPAGPAVAREHAATPLRPRRGRTFSLLAVYFTLRSFIAGMVSVHALVLLAGLGLSPGAAVTAAALIGPAQVGARLLDWGFGRHATPLIAGAVGAVLLPLGFLAPLLGAPALALPLAYGMSNGILTISRGTLPLYLLGAEGYAVTLGRLAMPVLIAQAVAPTMTAPLISAFPISSVLLIAAALAAVAAACLAPLRSGRGRSALP
jgi:MFS family permease